MKKPLGSLIVGAAVAAVALLTAVTGRGAAPAGRYTIAGGTVHDTRTKLTWQQMVPAAMYNQAEASSYCVSLALSGRTWRLPTMREILTIVDLTVGLPGPTIDTTAFPDTPAGFFWTSTQYSGTPTNYWSANFQYGFAYGNTLSDTSYVRCVSFARPASSAGR